MPRYRLVGPIKRNYKPNRRFWKEDEVNMLIELWKERIYALRTNKKNRHIVKEIANIMKLEYPWITADDIRSKIKNLTSGYRREKRFTDPLGVSTSDWPLFSQVHSVFAAFEADKLKFMVDEISYDKSEQDEKPSDIFEISTSPVLLPVKAEPMEHEEPCVFTVNTMPAEILNEAFEAESEDTTSAISAAARPDLQKIFEARFNKVEDSLQELMHHEKEMHKKLLELEYKKMNLLGKLIKETTELRTDINKLFKK